MSLISLIQWCMSSWNPWHGCKKWSAGCKFCYMYRDKEKYGQDPTVVMRSKTKFLEPLKWKEPRVIFTCSWSDWFIDEADGWRAEAWEIIKATPQHTYLILTKRAERMADQLPADWGEGYENVVLGVSVESQSEVFRIGLLEKCPAKRKFISFEPLLGPITEGYIGNVDCIIIGGESGNNTGKYLYRPCELEWIEGIVSGYEQAPGKTAIFIKQLGTHLAKKLKLKDRHGGDANEFPERFKIRQLAWESKN